MIHATETKQLSRAAFSLLFTELNFGTKPDSQYPSEDVLEVLARSAFDDEFVQTTAKELQFGRGDEIELQYRSPLTKLLLYHPRNLSLPSAGVRSAS